MLWSIGGNSMYSDFACLKAGETFTYNANFVVTDTVSTSTDTAMYTLTVTGRNDRPVLVNTYGTVYDIQGGQTTPCGNAFDGIQDVDTDLSLLSVYSINGVVVTSFPATATGSQGGTFTIQENGDATFKDTGNQLTSGETSVLTVRVTDGSGGYVNRPISVFGL